MKRSSYYVASLFLLVTSVSTIVAGVVRTVKNLTEFPVDVEIMQRGIMRDAKVTVLPHKSKDISMEPGLIKSVQATVKSNPEVEAQEFKTTGFSGEATFVVKPSGPNSYVVVKE